MSSPQAVRAVLCADIGTSSLKAALVDHDGRLKAFAREPYPAELVAQGRADSADWDRAFIQAVSSLSTSAQQKGIEISSVCISGNGPTFVPVSRNGEALKGLFWHDGRTAPPSAALRDGSRPRSLFLPRAAWFARERRDEYQNCQYLISSQEWLSMRLGAAPVTILPSPAYEPIYWDADQLEAWELDAAKFPPFVALGDRIGNTDHQAEIRYGLKAGIPIIAGGPDFVMALIGVGAIENGVICDRAGTSEGINVCTNHPAHTHELRTLPHLREGLWNVGAILPTTGRLFEWFRTITGQTGKSYNDMLEEIGEASPREFKAGQSGKGGFFFPDLHAVDGLGASSAFISTAGLTTRAELGRAVIESIGFMVRGAIEKLEKHGYRVDGMRLSGGQAKNPAWNRMKADMTGHCLAVPVIADGELAGNACAALVALGEVSDLESAVERVVRIEQVYEPDQAAYAMHSERYDAYRAMSAKMEKFLS